MDKEKSCVHNSKVICDKPNCDNCGWNPKVEEERKKHFVRMIWRRRVKE